MIIDELAELPDAEYQAWVDAATDTDMAEVLANDHAESLIDYKAQELRELVQELAVNGCLGFEQMNTEQLKAALNERREEMRK